MLRTIIATTLLWLACLCLPTAALAQDDLGALVNALGQGNYNQTEAAIGALAATGRPEAARVLNELEAGNLVARKADGAVFIGTRDGTVYDLEDPLTGAAAGQAQRSAVEAIRVNNRIRRAVRAAMGSLTLQSADAGQRRAAANAIFAGRDPEAIEALDAAIAAETDAGIATLMRQARASAILNSDRPEAEKTEAVNVIGARGDRDALVILTPLAEGEGALAQAAGSALEAVQGRLALIDIAQNVFFGLSLGSVLLLAAIGLAVTFGVMGVINMAHGEMVMLGAYTTFMVQQLLRDHAPALFDLSLLIALPAAFLVAGLVGVAIERGVIRFLYGRPLETLLATWGVSLILQQGVRTLFGASNREVSSPSWMSGTIDVFGASLTVNRLVIILFAMAVLAGLMLLLKATRFGLSIRAVTQNRRMAAAMGIRTPWVDAMTFGLGSGIAGVAGVALSQIDNVSPNLGQSYIIDSFLVVVFGGVGSLWGTLTAAMSLGIVNKFLEPYAGAVLAKIFILVLVILFIQKRPRGLFAQKGRAVEA
ncbi:urea ABC transporter permease subunit UrtB [Aureimonas altamirensis]|uniref:urea ABC transporter permease subunit UrtB n=1 Tax=Aureimonas altamirensis TaxID=370622 RepID=UPI001E2CA1EA|nr:urea ABC transporter permease subunit UrtB [Aureimonas altamirensis]UHD46857.1 urea ABC transporter permease subunit UrtB [Aureimonas altamirensis]